MLKLKTVEFTTVGMNNWTCPAGITSIILMIQGGGGGGSRGGPGNGSRGGGGGLSTFLVPHAVTVIPGQVYTVFVGAGGTGSGPFGDSIEGSPGQISYFSDDGSTFIIGNGANAGQPGAREPQSGVPAWTGGYCVSPTPNDFSPINSMQPLAQGGSYSGGITPARPFGSGMAYGAYASRGTNPTAGGLGGAGTGGNSSDAGIGGRGGNGATATVSAGNGSDAPPTSYGAGGGGGGGQSTARTGFPFGGTGAGGRIIILYAE